MHVQGLLRLEGQAAATEKRQERRLQRSPHEFFQVRIPPSPLHIPFLEAHQCHHDTIRAHSFRTPCISIYVSKGFTSHTCAVD